MAKISTELTVVTIHPRETNIHVMPQWQFEVVARDMISGEIDVLSGNHNLDLFEMKQNKMFYWVNKTAGTGTPTLKVNYFNQNGLFRFVVTPGSSPYEFPGRFVSIIIEETGANTCTHDALIKIV